MTDITQRLDLGGVRPPPIDVPDDHIRACKTPGDAIRLAVHTGFLDDKEVYLSLGYDAGTWTRITKDQASLSLARVPEFCALVGNNVLLRWINLQMGYVPVMLQTEAEMRLHKALAEIESRDKQIAVLKDMVREVAP